MMWEVEKIIEACVNASKIALKWYENPPMELKEDDSVVTVADKEIENYLTDFLTAGNDAFFIGEETEHSKSEEYLRQALSADCCYVVDPIDGTAPYSCGFPAWGHSIGMMRNGKLADGAIYLPVQDAMLITDGDAVWHIRGLRSPVGPTREKLVFPAGAWDVRRPVGLAQCYAKNYALNLKNQVFVWSGCIAECYYLLTGKILAYLTVVKLWDIAAAGAIFSRGAKFTGLNEDGTVFDGTVNEKSFILGAGEKNRWLQTGATCFAPSREICENVFKGVGKRIAD